MFSQWQGLGSRAVAVLHAGIGMSCVDTRLGGCAHPQPGPPIQCVQLQPPCSLTSAPTAGMRPAG